MSATPRLEVGLQLFPGAAPEAVEQAQAVEQLGFDSIWIADHFHGAGREVDWVVPECMSVLGAMAALTSRVRLGTCVASTTKRDPAILAHAALTLSQLSGGRFELGLGTGFGPDVRAFGIRVSKPVGRLEASLEILHGLMRSSPERPFDYTWGERVFENAFLNLPGAVPPPVLLAAIGPRVMELTRERADGWLPFGLTPDVYREFLGRVVPERPGFRPKLWLPTFLERPGEDRSAEAEATGRLYLSMAPAILETALDQAAIDVEVPNSLDWSPAVAKEIAKAIPRELALAAVLHGSPDDCIETLGKFHEAGCQEVVLRITETSRRREDAGRIARDVISSMPSVKGARG